MMLFTFKRKGFTLVEMVMVLVIIGLLAAIIVPQFSAQMDDAKEAQTRANLDNLRSGIAMYSKRFSGAYPTTLGSLSSTTPQIMITIPLYDGWGTSFAYSQATGLVTCGANVKCLSTW